MRYYEQRNRKRLTVGHSGNSLIILIAINLVVFVTLALINLFYFFGADSAAGANAGFQEDILNWVMLPASFDVFITRPWTLFTYMIAHTDVWHIIANMLWLWAFGYILQDLSGYRKLIPIFIYGALAGAVAFMAAYNFLPPLKDALPYSKLLGASAGVMAVAVCVTIMAPDYRIFPMLNGGIPLWALTIIFIIIDLATIPKNNTGGHVAHLAGAGMGLLFMFFLKKGYDWSTWMNNVYDWMNNLFNPDKPTKGKNFKEQLFYNSKVQPFKKSLNITQQRVDEILDKIGQKGYSSLNDDEKEILKRASKEDL